MDFTPNIAEIWTLYSIGTLMIAARVASRARLVGLAGFHRDDYLVFLAWAGYTTVTVIAHVFILKAKGMHTSLLTPEDRAAMPKEEYAAWEYGSQIFLVGLTTYFVIVWILKFNMLFFYHRIVQGLWSEKFIQPVMVLVGATGIGLILTLVLMCRPFHKLWQVYPDPGPNCVPQNAVIFYTMLACNLVTDLCILLIPLPVVMDIQKASIFRKLGLYFLFSLGIFCMVASILRVVFIFKFNQSGISAMWSIREDFVAVFVGQAPMVYPMLSRKFWRRHGNTTDPSSKRSYANGTGGATSGEGESHQLSTNPTSSRRRGAKPKDPYSITAFDVTVVANNSESQESIVREKGEDAIVEDEISTHSGNAGSSAPGGQW